MGACRVPTSSVVLLHDGEADAVTGDRPLSQALPGGSAGGDGWEEVTYGAVGGEGVSAVPREVDGGEVLGHEVRPDGEVGLAHAAVAVVAALRQVDHPEFPCQWQPCHFFGSLELLSAHWISHRRCLNAEQPFDWGEG